MQRNQNFKPTTPHAYSKGWGKGDGWFHGFGEGDMDRCGAGSGMGNGVEGMKVGSNIMPKSNLVFVGMFITDAEAIRAVAEYKLFERS